MRAWECRTSQRLRYGLYAALCLGSKTVASTYSLDLLFLQQVQTLVQQIDGIATDTGTSGERDVQYKTDGLYRLSIYAEQNKKGMAGKQELF